MVVAAAGVWVANRAIVVRGELAAVDALRPELMQALDERGFADLDGPVAKFDEHAGAAASTAGDPVWRAAEFVPFIGPNLAAVRTVAESLDLVADDVATPLVGIAGELSQRGLLDDGALDVDFIAAAHGPFLTAATSLDDAESALSGIKRSLLVSEVTEGVDEVQTLVESLSDLVDGVSGVTGVLPRMLGSDGPRSILVMLQNNAELRSGGGITGSFAEIRAERGTLDLVRQADSGDFERTTRPVVDVPESTTALYGDVIGRFVQNATTTPDFTLSSELASAWWEDLTGRAPDTVIAIDPLVLRSLLTVTGPVELADGATLTQKHFVRDVLVTPYMTLDGREQTRYFEQLTKSYFSALMAAEAPPEQWMEALSDPVEQGRISIWSAHEDEAALMAGSTLGGPLSRHDQAGDSAFAVYLNDTTGAKMDSELSVGLGLAVGSCRADEQPQVAVRVELSNDAPLEAGSAWPTSMTGGGRWGVPPGDIGTAVAVAAPPGWFFGGTTVDGTRRASVDVADSGHPTSAVEVTLRPGESAEVEIRFVAPTRDTVTPQLLHTPLLQGPEASELTSISCE